MELGIPVTGRKGQQAILCAVGLERCKTYIQLLLTLILPSAQLGLLRATVGFDSVDLVIILNLKEMLYIVRNFNI